MTVRLACTLLAAATVGLTTDRLAQASNAAPPQASPATTGPTTPVPIADGRVQLSPENTNIGFVGTHTGAKPDPRIGGFEKFQGVAEVDPATKTLKSASVEIQTDSIWTQFDKLSTHLKSPDFFDTRTYPTARFQSTSMAPATGDQGTHTINGNLTLHGTTRPVSFPARVEITDAGLTLVANLKLDRTQFGMDRMTDGVEKTVTITIAVGQKTQPVAAPAEPSKKAR